MGHDIDNMDTLREAGLGFTVGKGKDTFVGADAHYKAKEQGLPVRRLVQVQLSDANPMLYHGEPVYRNGEIVGDIRSVRCG